MAVRVDDVGAQLVNPDYLSALCWKIHFRIFTR
jgi:hypothetical protein